MTEMTVGELKRILRDLKNKSKVKIKIGHESFKIKGIEVTEWITEDGFFSYTSEERREMKLDGLRKDPNPDLRLVGKRR